MNRQELEAKKLDDLIDYYIEHLDPSSTREQIADSFNIVLRSDGKVSQRVNYNKVHRDAKQMMIDEIIDYLSSPVEQSSESEVSLIQAPTKVFPPAPKINKYGISDITNVELKPLSESDKDKLRIEQLERENQRLKEYIKQINSKKLIEGIPEKQKQINKLIQEKNSVKNRNKDFIIDGIHEWHEYRFKPKHHDMNFDEWLEFQKTPKDNQDKLIKETIERLKANPFDWNLDLNLFNNYGKKKLTQLLIDFLQKDLATKVNTNDHSYISIIS